MPLTVLDDDHFHDECAVVGVQRHAEASKLCYLSLFAMQHRGQEGAGIVSSDGRDLIGHKDMGLVADVFTSQLLEELRGFQAIGHTRYATFGGKDWQNLQPFVANFSDFSFAVAHNGNLVNSDALRRELEGKGAIFSSTSDTEVFLHLIAREKSDGSFAERIARSLQTVRGAYSLVLIGGGSLFGIRDPYGVRPLSIGKVGDGHAIASETCAFDLIGASFIRDVEPGEIVEITKEGEIKSFRILTDEKPVEKKSGLCVFEYVYFSRPDSTIAARNVYDVRKKLGTELAREQPAVVDMVIPVPDSGVPAAVGYSQQLGIPMELGLIRNHYIGRTFIEPKQSVRDIGVKIKLNANEKLLRGKKVAVVDDSIVRGTTCKKIIKMLREAGASEVHFRVSSPPTTGPCYYGIDTPSKEELIANSNTIDQIRQFIGADSLGYLSNEGMFRAVGDKRERYCDACFSGEYRLGVTERRGGCGR